MMVLPNYLPPVSRCIRAALLAVLCGSPFFLLACARSGPPATQYILGTAPAAATATNALKGRPAIEVMSVRIPDYLDTRDIVVRSDNRLLPSSSGQWGERLSIGMTRALASSLAARLPNMSVVTMRPIEPPVRQVIVDVTAFEARPDQKAVLIARWTVADRLGHATLLAQETVLVESSPSMEDKDLVTAMSRVVDDLASQIAAGIERTRP